MNFEEFCLTYSKILRGAFSPSIPADQYLHKDTCEQYLNPAQQAEYEEARLHATKDVTSPEVHFLFLVADGKIPSQHLCLANVVLASRT
ncbi:hypothetical protein DA2_0736 [Desulfovibrio sp. A2]|nr:hypothetical protein DA2_0736 [Desulfovibrio sp. A2]